MDFQGILAKTHSSTFWLQFDKLINKSWLKTLSFSRISKKASRYLSWIPMVLHLHLDAEVSSETLSKDGSEIMVMLSGPITIYKVIPKGRLGIRECHFWGGSVSSIWERIWGPRGLKITLTLQWLILEPPSVGTPLIFSSWTDNMDFPLASGSNMHTFLSAAQEWSPLCHLLWDPLTEKVPRRHHSESVCNVKESLNS